MIAGHMLTRTCGVVWPAADKVTEIDTSSGEQPDDDLTSTLPTAYGSIQTVRLYTQCSRRFHKYGESADSVTAG